MKEPNILLHMQASFARLKPCNNLAYCMDLQWFHCVWNRERRHKWRIQSCKSSSRSKPSLALFHGHALIPLYLFFYHYMSYYFAGVLIIFNIISYFRVWYSDCRRSWKAVTNLHKVKVHHSRDLCLDCLHPSVSVRERPGVAIEGDLHLITRTSVHEEK